MLKVFGNKLDFKRFPDGTILGELNPYYRTEPTITWLYENDEEMVKLFYIVSHLREHGRNEINLILPYIPNARMDRVKGDAEIFTLKHFASFINSLNFKSVKVADPHSYVSEALFNNFHKFDLTHVVKKFINEEKVDMLFFPDEGAMKRYSSEYEMPYSFGIKKRDWKTGNILGLDVVGENVEGKTILITDDICSKGGTFFHSAKKLRELGAKNVFLYITHCENSILEGELINSGLVNKIYTTNSIFTKKHDLIHVEEIF